jgi:hypothetical protein
LTDNNKNLFRAASKFSDCKKLSRVIRDYQ